MSNTPTTLALPAPAKYYAVADWEVNGRDDSDWYGAVFNDQTRKIEVHMIGTTRGGMEAPKEWRERRIPTSDIVEQIRVECMVPSIAKSIRYYDQNEIKNPEVKNLPVGTAVVFNRNVRVAVTSTCECPKCKGTGKWVNPAKPTDVRQCFACSGTGQTKDRNAKRKYSVIAEGTKAVIATGPSWFGTFYSNGYKQKNRYNARIGVTVGDKLQYVAMSALSLDRTPLSDDQIQRMAVDRSYHGQLSQVVGCRTWLTNGISFSR